jgi:hypothetical protein
MAAELLVIPVPWINDTDGSPSVSESSSRIDRNAERRWTLWEQLAATTRALPGRPAASSEPIGALARASHNGRGGP